MLTALIRPVLSARSRGPACLRQQSVNSGRRGRTVSWSRQLLQLLVLRLGLLQDGDVGGRRLSRGRRSLGRQRVRRRNWAKSLAMGFGVPCRLPIPNRGKPASDHFRMADNPDIIARIAETM